MRGRGFEGICGPQGVEGARFRVPPLMTGNAPGRARDPAARARLGPQRSPHLVYGFEDRAPRAHSTKTARAQHKGPTLTAQRPHAHSAKAARSQHNCRTRTAQRPHAHSTTLTRPHAHSTTSTRTARAQHKDRTRTAQGPHAHSTTLTRKERASPARDRKERASFFFKYSLIIGI